MKKKTHKWEACKRRRSTVSLFLRAVTLEWCLSFNKSMQTCSTRFCLGVRHNACVLVPNYALHSFDCSHLLSFALHSWNPLAAAGRRLWACALPVPNSLRRSIQPALPLFFPPDCKCRTVMPLHVLWTKFQTPWIYMFLSKILPVLKFSLISAANFENIRGKFHPPSSFMCCAWDF